MDHYKAVQKKFAHETINAVRAAKAQSPVKPDKISSIAESAPQFQVDEHDTDLYDPQ